MSPGNHAGNWWRRELRATGRAIWERRGLLGGGAGLIVGVFVVYWPALWGDFIWDDDSYILNNEALRSLDGLRRIWLVIGATPQYYPLVFTTFWIEHFYWSYDPFGYHVVNVALHAAAAALLWRLLIDLGVPGAWFAAAVFALHPVQVESVAWITERKNVLSVVFYLLAFRAYARFARITLGGSGMPMASGSGSWRYLWALICFCAALLSKSVTCSMPAAMLLAIWWRRGRVTLRDAALLMPFFVLGLAAAGLTAWIELFHLHGPGRGAIGTDWELSLIQRCLLAGRVVCFYASKLVWPVDLTFIYPRWEIDPRDWRAYPYPLVVLAAVAALWLARRRIGRGPLVCALLFIGTLTPALGFVNVYPFRYSFVADHFQYLASSGMIILIVAGAVHCSEGGGARRRPGSLAKGAACACLLLLAALTWRQTHVYQNLESLWRDTIAKNPSAWMAKSNLALLLIDDGRAEEAIAMMHDAMRLRPHDVGMHGNLALALERARRPDAAIMILTDALRADPDSARLNFALGCVLSNADAMRTPCPTSRRRSELSLPARGSWSRPPRSGTPDGPTKQWRCCTTRPWRPLSARIDVQ